MDSIDLLCIFHISIPVGKDTCDLFIEVDILGAAQPVHVNARAPVSWLVRSARIMMYTHGCQIDQPTRFLKRKYLR